MPADVLALGRHLVNELGLEKSTDTLSQWLAHHVAELIDQVRTQPPGRKRLEAQKQATETILRIWEHRENLPHRAYPLAPYKDLMKILDLLQPSNNPYRFSPLSQIDQLGAILFDRLSRLIILLLLMHWQDARRAKAAPAAVKAMNDEEQQVLKSLNGWVSVLTVAVKKPRTRKGGSKKPARSSQSEAKPVHDSIIRIIDDSTRTLAELRNEVSQTAPRKLVEVVS